MTKKTFYIPIFVLIATIAYLMQTQLFLCGDVAYLLHVTQVMLSGGTYAKDFFETNPPMILGLYSPVVLLANYFAVSIIVMLRFYIISLVFISMVINLFILKKIFAEQSQWILNIFLGVLLYSLLFLPAGDFGQREHLFMILFLPYVFSAVLIAEDKTLPLYWNIVIGCMAGLGIGMKPFFLAPLLLIELVLMFETRQLWVWVRSSVITLLFVLFIYLALVHWLVPSYGEIILPLVSQLYFISARESWSVFFHHLPVIFCLLTLFYLLGYLFFKKINVFNKILIAGFIGMVIAFVIPQSAWYYHTLPAFIFGVLLLAYLILTQPKSLWTLVAIGLGVIPFFSSINYFHEMMLARKASDRHDVIAYVQSNPKIHSVNCFSASYTQDCFPLIFLTHTQYAGRSPFFWWLKGLVILEKNSKTSARIFQNKKYLISASTEDLKEYKADLIVVNQKDFNQTIDDHFNIIQYFSQNQDFREAWKSYRLVEKIGDYQLYQRESL